LNILIINGPNLNLLGVRKPEIYGTETLEALNDFISGYFKKIKLEFYQSNHEGKIIDKIHFAHKDFQGIVLNPGALTHYSYALRDAIESSPLPVLEVHMSNTDAREEFRQKSVIAPVCWGSISGLGKYGYVLAIQALAHKISRFKK